MGLLISCGGTGPTISVPSEELTTPPKPDLPEAGAGNHAKAQYLLDAEEWMDGRVDQVASLAQIICALNDASCPQ